MSKKITISVPDGLHEKMDKLRDSLNFSQVFQKAISELIQKKDDLKRRIKQDTDINEIVKRLKNEKAESEGGYFDKGKNNGLIWAKAAHYEELKFALIWDPQKGLPDNQNNEGELLKTYFANTIKKDGLMELDPKAKAGANDYVLTYFKGWKEGVQGFWDEIEDKI